METESWRGRGRGIATSALRNTSLLAFGDAPRFPAQVLVEYKEKSEAEAAIAEMDGADLLGQTLACDWAFREGKGGKKR